MEYWSTYHPRIASAFFVTVIIIAHIISDKSYHWTQHTISHLGAQNYHYKYLMQLGFIGFGMVLCIGALSHGVQLRNLPIVFYGVCVALTGVFCAEPWFASSTYNVQEANVHSCLAQLAGLFFTLGIVVQIYFASDQDRTVHTIFLILVILSSVAFGAFRDHQGIAQRVLYAISLYWLSFLYKP